MSGQIRISPEGMQQKSVRYRAQADNVHQVISQMDSLLAELQEEWEGEASRSYSERYQELRPGFERVEELIREIATSLDQTANVVRETDIHIARKYQS